MMHFSKPMNAFFEKHTRANRKRAKEVKLSVNVLKVMSPPSPASFVSPEIVDIHDDSGYSYNARGDELLTFASLMPASDEDLVMISGWYGVEGEDMGNIRDNVAATGAGSQPSTQSHPYNSNLQNLAYDSNPNMPSSKTNPDLNLKLIHANIVGYDFLAPPSHSRNDSVEDIKRQLPEAPITRKLTPAPIRIPNLAIHGPRVQVQQSANTSAADSSHRPPPSAYVAPHREEDQDMPGSPELLTSVSGSSLARALIGDSFILSRDDHLQGDNASIVTRYNRKSVMTTTSRADSAILPRNDFMNSAFWNRTSFDLNNPATGNRSSTVPPVPPIPSDINTKSDKTISNVLPPALNLGEIPVSASSSFGNVDAYANLTSTSDPYSTMPKIVEVNSAEPSPNVSEGFPISSTKDGSGSGGFLKAPMRSSGLGIPSPFLSNDYLPEEPVSSSEYSPVPLLASSTTSKSIPLNLGATKPLDTLDKPALSPEDPLPTVASNKTCNAQQELDLLEGYALTSTNGRTETSPRMSSPVAPNEVCKILSDEKKEKTVPSVLPSTPPRTSFNHGHVERRPSDSRLLAKSDSGKKLLPIGERRSSATPSSPSLEHRAPASPLPLRSSTALASPASGTSAYPYSILDQRSPELSSGQRSAFSSRSVTQTPGSSQDISSYNITVSPENSSTGYTPNTSNGQTFPETPLAFSPLFTGSSWGRGATLSARGTSHHVTRTASATTGSFPKSAGLKNRLNRANTQATPASKALITVVESANTSSESLTKATIEEVAPSMTDSTTVMGPEVSLKANAVDVHKPLPSMPLPSMPLPSTPLPSPAVSSTPSIRPLPEIGAIKAPSRPSALSNAVDAGGLTQDEQQPQATDDTIAPTHLTSETKQTGTTDITRQPFTPHQRPSNLNLTRKANPKPAQNVKSQDSTSTVPQNRPAPSRITSLGSLDVSPGASIIAPPPYQANPVEPSVSVVECFAGTSTTASGIAVRKGSRSRPPLPSGPRRPSGSNTANTTAIAPPVREVAEPEAVAGKVPRNKRGSSSSPSPSAGCILQSLPKFQVPVPKYRGYTMEAAKWTFTPLQLQAIVSRAIKSSAEASSVRLLKLQTIDGPIQEDLRRLESEKTNLKSKYKFLAQKRGKLTQRIVTSQSVGISSVKFDTLISELVNVCESLDHTAEELYCASESMCHLRRICDMHSTSALAMALRKLNSSFLKQATENETLREQIATLEEERDEAWNQAVSVANEFDDLTDAHDPHSSKYTNNRSSSRIVAKRKSSGRVTKAGLRSVSSRRSQRSSNGSLVYHDSFLITRPCAPKDIPPVPRIPRRNSMSGDELSRTSMAHFDSPTSEIGRQEKLYALLTQQMAVGKRNRLRPRSTGPSSFHSRHGSLLHSRHNSARSPGFVRPLSEAESFGLRSASLPPDSAAFRSFATYQHDKDHEEAALAQLTLL